MNKMDIEWPIADADFSKIIGGEIIDIVNSSNIEEEFYTYSINFNKSAHILTEYLLKEPKISNLDSYFFSLAYLYRHSIELIIKSIGFKYIVKLDDRKAFLKDTFHNLVKIFETITPFIKTQLEKDSAAFNWLVTYFDDISAIDKESDSFRYPFGISIEKAIIYFETTKKFSIKSVFEKQTQINLLVFANKMEVAFDMLNSIYNDKFGDSSYYKDYKPTFLEEGGSYYSQSVVGYQYNAEKFSPFVKAYTESAEYLYKRICDDISLKEALFIPMCYLYRNAVELSLKETLFEECEFTFQEAVKHLKVRKHSIQALWNVIRGKVIEHADAPAGDTTIENVERYITQLHNIDGTSDKFRYPTNKCLQLHFSTKKKLDIDNVNKFFSQLLSFLDAVNGMMSQHNEWKAEMEAEYRSEMASYYNSSDY
jgi:hypothetical protein